MFARRGLRLFSTMNPSGSTAMSVFKKSCYNKLDFKINEDKPLSEAVARLKVFNVGCLAVVDKESALVGVLSKRDYIDKIAALNKTHDGLKVKDICTYGSNIIVAKKDDSLESCMNKMLFKNILSVCVCVCVCVWCKGRECIFSPLSSPSHTVPHYDVM